MTLQTVHHIQEELNKIRDVVDQQTFIEVVLPNLSQWLSDIYISEESTKQILFHFRDLNISAEDIIQRTYHGNIVNYSPKGELNRTLPTERFFDLCDLIEPRLMSGSVWGIVDDKTRLQINFNTKQVCLVRESGGRHPHDQIIPIIEAVPEEVIVYDTYLLDQPRTFKIKWSSRVTDRIFTTAGESAGATIKEIEDYLANAGFSHSPRLLGGALPCMINTMIEEGKAKIKEEIDNPGFYYDNNKEILNVVKKDITLPTAEELFQATEVLAELKSYFTENLSILATVFKWGCMAEFSYAMKQAGKWMPWLYLRGTAGSGKTTLAKIILFIWGLPSPENSIGGSSFDTEARIGANISKSCDPLVVNEPASTFIRSRTHEMVKVAIESTIGRSKYKNGYYGGIPAFAPVIFTANQYVPEDDALLRRLITLSFTHADRKIDDNKNEFERKFHVETPGISPLKAFQAIGRYLGYKMVHNTGLIMDDWQEVIDKLLREMYNELNMDMPVWLTRWTSSESLDDFDEEQREEVREFLIDTINQAKRQIKVYNETGYAEGEITFDNYSSVTSEDFEYITWQIIQQQQKGWYGPHIGRDGVKYVIFRHGIRKAMAEAIGVNTSLKSTAELLGWDYVQVKQNGKNQKVIRVKFDDFMKFLYPDLEIVTQIRGYNHS